MARLVEKVRLGNCGPLLVENFGPPLKLGASAKKSNRGPKPIQGVRYLGALLHRDDRGGRDEQKIVGEGGELRTVGNCGPAPYFFFVVIVGSPDKVLSIWLTIS